MGVHLLNSTKSWEVGMTTNELALFGGKPIIVEPFKKFNTFGPEEIAAASEVVSSGILSEFVGSKGEFFLGGKNVRAFEEEWAAYFNVKHAISVNSWTSGLNAMVGACGVQPFDEVITTPWTMSATAMAPLQWNAIPVFADIDESYNICPIDVRRKITEKTTAILAADIFGRECAIPELMQIASEYNLKVITDTAQAPGVVTPNGFIGTSSDIGGYSLNYHKHIHTGEGGMIVTNDDALAWNCRLIRNHGENLIESGSSYTNIIGQNYRLGEVEAAIGRVQLKKLAAIVADRQDKARELIKRLACYKGIRFNLSQDLSEHAFYVLPFEYDERDTGVVRSKIISALEAEGLKGLAGGYQNLHLLPTFQKKNAYGQRGFPWSMHSREVNYTRGICPIAENKHEKSTILFEMCLHELEKNEIELIDKCFDKVWENLERLRA